jgi:heparosan-N-sulfate-glucuronate 5-epimerase
MSVSGRLQYYRRIFSAYLTSGKSHLTFWHGAPSWNEQASVDRLGQYYMGFFQKANYSGDHDALGIPMLNYHGRIGPQYNPIAIAQWGLGNHDLFKRTGNYDNRRKFIAAGDWLCEHLEQNPFGIWVWNHYFDWEYKSLLKSPWYSGLAQGQGISLLVRAHAQTGDQRYCETADRAFASFLVPTDRGGVAFTDRSQNLWIEEYIVSPPTHILNGFIWAAWGIYDYFLANGENVARDLFAKLVFTLLANLERYDLGFWSLYEQSGTMLPMVASRFYHELHIVQLRGMYCLTGEVKFAQIAERWRQYTLSSSNRTRAFCYKAAFKLCYY